MKKTILRYAGITCAILAFQLILSFVFINDMAVAMQYGMLLGFGSMILAFAVTYFAILHFKNHYNNGSVSFKQALKISTAITVLGSICYVVTWLVIYYGFIPDFWDKYAAYAIEGMRKAGTPEAEIQKQMAKMNEHGELYKNNTLYVIGVTFTEVLPLGLVISLIASGIASYNSKRSATA